MNQHESICGFFLKVGFDPNLSLQDLLQLANSFRPYVWSAQGIGGGLVKLKCGSFGNDLVLALFQFYVKPSAPELQRMKPIESYREKDRSIGIPIIVN